MHAVPSSPAAWGGIGGLVALGACQLWQRRSFGQTRPTSHIASSTPADAAADTPSSSSAPSSPQGDCSPVANKAGASPLPPDIEQLHLSSVMNGEETYKDPKTGYQVFTAIAHNRRGFCCGSGCRHCPYGHHNVGKPEEVKKARAEAKLKKKTGAPKRGGIYTRTGDQGKSGLFTGERVGKDEMIFEVIGTVDELNSAVGVAMEYCISAKNGLDEHLNVVQSKLMDVGSYVATPRGSASEDRITYTQFTEDEVKVLEDLIDSINQKLPPMRAFILPTGGMAASHLHLARTICRRCERCMVRHFKDEPGLPVTKYVNRLSDTLFVMARLAAQHDGREDVWRPDRGLPKPGAGPQKEFAKK